MDRTARVPEPIQWSQGMALGPQHFQQNDIYWQALLQHQMFQLEPFYWGLIDLQLDESALRTGKVVVQRLHAVMPDGFVVQYPPPDQRGTLEIDVSNEPLIRENKPLMVQLAAPIRAGGLASGTRSIQRFDSLPGSLEPDENTGESPLAVNRMRVRLSLQPGEQLPAKYVSLPLLQLRRDAGGQFNLTDYHPPLLQLGASQFLGDAGLQAKLRALAELIRRKARELLGATDATAPSITNSYQRQIVRQLVAGLPQFELLVRMPAAHPVRCYAALAQLVGHVAGICADPVPMLLEPYRHDNAAPGFAQAIRHLWQVVSTLSAAYAAIVFDRVRDNVFTCELPPGMRTDRFIVEVKSGDSQGAQAAGHWLRQACIGSASTMALLRQRRLPGARVRPLSPAQLAELGVQAGGFYEISNQAVQQDEKLIPVIQKETVLHIEGPANTVAPANIVLYVPSGELRPEGGRGANSGG